MKKIFSFLQKSVEAHSQTKFNKRSEFGLIRDISKLIPCFYNSMDILRNRVKKTKVELIQLWGIRRLTMKTDNSF